MTASNTDHLLASIRQEIDEIDDQLVQLILRRLATSTRVRDIKGGAGGITMTPYRPVREAQIMRRLAAQTVFGTASAALTRLWRVILSASINAQATVTLHVDNLRGSNAHHQAETVFKAFGRALRMAIEPDERLGDLIPSTKGSL